MSTNKPLGCSLLTIAIWLFLGVCWIVNLVKLLNCDFVEPWRDEIIHLIGLIPGVSIITAWM